MENVLGKTTLPESSNAQMENDSTKKFQNFIFELFEGNGLLSDLRAHFRGQIVTVLKNACNGDPIPSQKHLKERLDLKCQAINILITDYLLSQEFNYTLSVFVSELPLSNMMNSFSEYLQKLKISEKVYLQDNDIECLLKILGVNVDSENVCNIIKMYKIEKKPLLMCLFKIMCFYHKPSAERALSAKSSNSYEECLENIKEDCDDVNEDTEKNKHHVFCDNCLESYTKLNDKYKHKLKYFADLFKQVRNAYETEMENMKSKENQKMRRLISVYVARNKTKLDELEESFRQKQEALECSLSQKKKFLCEVAQTLRSQHEKMSIAMKHVRGEDKRLINKEITLQRLLAEAEENIKQRGESIKAQVSNELIAVNEQLEKIQHEKSLLDREKAELKYMREKSNTENGDDVNSRYVRLEAELMALKQYLESKNSSPKYMMHSSTNTELNVYLPDSLTLNNQNVHPDEKRQCVNPIQVTNDLKKDKNVNYDMEDAITRMSADMPSDIINNLQLLLTDDNKELKENVSQLQCQLQELMARNARLQTELETAHHTIHTLRSASRLNIMPTESSDPFYLTLQRMLRRTHDIPINSQTVTGQPQNLPPSLQDEKQGLEVNVQPKSPVELTPSAMRPTASELRPSSANPRLYTLELQSNLRPNSMEMRPNSADKRQNQPDLQPQSHCLRQSTPKWRMCSPNGRPSSPNGKYNSERHSEHKTITQPTLEPILRSVSSPDRKISNSNIQATVMPSLRRRHKSPTTVLREAKQRLRKLEIEAEAVEMSYLDYKKRRLQQTAFTTTCDKKELDVSATAKSSKNGIDIPHGDHDAHISELLNTTDFQVTVEHNTDDALESRKMVQHRNTSADYIKNLITDYRKLYVPSANTQQTELDKNEELSNTSNCRVDESRDRSNAGVLDLDSFDKKLNNMYDIEVVIASPSVIADFKYKMKKSDVKHLVAVETPEVPSLDPNKPDKEVVIQNEKASSALVFYSEVQRDNIENYNQPSPPTTQDVPTEVSETDFSSVPFAKQELTYINESPEFRQSPELKGCRDDMAEMCNEKPSSERDGISECFKTNDRFSDEVSLEIDSREYQLDGDLWSSTSEITNSESKQ